MKDNEIIKAWTCCQGQTCNCKECPMEGVDGCWIVLKHKTLDLINRQKAEIKQKDTEIDILIRKKETLQDELAEIERLKAEAEMTEGYAEALEQKARKEFAERLKEKVAHIPAWGAVAKRKIDNLLEEMESERE